MSIRSGRYRGVISLLTALLGGSQSVPGVLPIHERVSPASPYRYIIGGSRTATLRRHITGLTNPTRTLSDGWAAGTVRCAVAATWSKDIIQYTIHVCSVELSGRHRRSFSGLATEFANLKEFVLNDN